ncbi:3-deoxy-7-phosphoheptulonate synthase [Pleionea mediterranea]|jgi:3-deoxy-7-phosphoheptulonate synthase|uniref:Phospho-2-dehydro-3-deoxyheptonate aldolase n=1 Tax=Pleionea mediterranea TaxID=523701 RepID=A0A316FPS4_9GAMM|nr:3-deoxy-7-phosphoheptulonate synthase [Pleionea mediterranea]PWK50781.1 3-deoxy-D-arabinoheptulosonate-7-phosphate synthase [Pleionea mediterranea]
MKPQLNNINIEREQVLTAPHVLKDETPLSDAGRATVLRYRQEIGDILDGNDKRVIVVAGPCSIHDIDAAKEYARRLKVLHDKFQDRLLIVMRVYFEKPRTTIGWKGLINDPHLNDTFDVEYGLRQARELLTWIAELGLPAGTEVLDPISPQYMAELFSWAAIGARTTESQTHREMASGLSMPVGFKNGTDGNIEVAINAMQSASSPHHFIGINQQGQVALIETRGNPHSHIILRGGKHPNYDSVHIAMLEQQLKQAKLEPRFVIDCSHGNSQKDYRLQPLVFRNVIEQIRQGNRSILGVMLESHLNEGQQKKSADPADLEYGVSITDACINWQTTEELLAHSYQQLA